MSWEDILKEDEEYFELSNFKKFLEDFITKMENAKNENELYDLIVNLRARVDNWAFRIEEKRDEGQPKMSYTLDRGGF
tara:strand:- start:737 stop:970 length:234 start_codon:yes stop_codon:yes gene_type:complete